MLRPSLTTLLMTLPTATLADAPRVTTDIAPIHSLVAQVMGDLGQPDLLVTGNASPHNFALRPSQASALEQASIVFFIGEDLTPWLEPVLDRLAPNAEHVELLNLPETKTLPFRKDGAFAGGHDHGEEEGHDDHDDHADEDKHDDHGHDDHADEDKHDDHGHDDHADEGKHDDHGHDDHANEDKHDDHGHDDHADEGKHDDHADEGGHEGHNHGSTDPHAWLNPENALAWLDVIANELSEHDADNAATYAANAQAAKDGLLKTIDEVKHTLEPAKDRQFVVFHDAYHYFEDHFGVEASGSISLGDAAAPGPARIERIQNVVREHNVTCVFSEPQFSEGLVNTVLDGTNANVAIMDPLGATLTVGPELYPNLLRAMATSIADC